MSQTSAVQFTCVCSLGLNADAQTADFTLREQHLTKWTRQRSEQGNKVNTATKWTRHQGKWGNKWMIQSATSLYNRWDSFQTQKQLTSAHENRMRHSKKNNISQIKVNEIKDDIANSWILCKQIHTWWIQFAICRASILAPFIYQRQKLKKT